MNKVESYEQIQTFVRDVRTLRKGFVTNFYWDPNKHPYWIADGSFEYDQYDGCVLMVHSQEKFTNLFYIASDFGIIAERLQTLQLKTPVMTDLVCKGEGDKELKAFKSMGFETYQSLYRMTHVGQLAGNDWVKDPRVKYGEEVDVTLVYEALQRDFDPLAEQLPSIKEIDDFKNRNQLLVIKDGQKLCGFLIFELSGQTWYLRYWYTSPDYRNQGVGSGLLKTSLIYGIDSKRQMFWVIADNTNAIVRYEHYGFTRENMNDYVMIKK